MKISIITVLNTVNYGSVLQTFATQKYWENLGFEVEFVDYRRKDQFVKSEVNRILKRKSYSIKQVIKKPLKNLLDIISAYDGYIFFRRFVVENINLTKQQYSSIDELKLNVPKADIYCTGSDQMWNSDWNQGVERSFFLDYAPEGKRRIAFSTSIGKTVIDEEEAEEIMPLLKKYDFITMREQSAVDLLNEYGIKSKLVLDPTLMLDRNFWCQYIGKRKIKEPYLFVNRLHYDHGDTDFNKAVKSFAKEKNLKIVRIIYSYSDINCGKKIYMPDVLEFLSLVYYADFIVTDSFHTTAFSINLNKQFAVIYPDYGTRIDNILKLTNLRYRKYTENCDIRIFSEIIDYSNINKKISSLNTECMEYFKPYSQKGK